MPKLVWFYGQFWPGHFSLTSLSSVEALIMINSKQLSNKKIFFNCLELIIISGLTEKSDVDDKYFKVHTDVNN